MNFVLAIPYHEMDVQKNISFGEKKTNTVMDGTFTKTMYLDSCMTMNAIHITFPILLREIMGTKSKCIFYPSFPDNQSVINQCSKIEELILTMYSIQMECKKNPVYSLKEQMASGFIHVYQGLHKDANAHIVLKISGVWESNHTFGLTFKFLKAFSL